jgi:hypothetical protein
MTPLLERHFHVTLIELVALQVPVVIARCEAHLIQLSALDEGGGTDSPEVLVGEGDDALSGAASEVGRGALVVEMVGGPTEPAGSVVGALAAVVTRILAVAREAVGEWRHLALAKHRPWGSAWLSHLAALQTIFPFTVFREGVSGSLGGVKAGDYV